ncbi:Bifunctional DNA primase/polymerase, N-terminal [Streptomyces sp. DvalAA-14]|uniref:bifunctional DNA primase/polymerase n=1 Tax=unclassified Streptomyces TaxID=2593676 RepID=UPI00081B6212|nr:MULTISPECIES: bifunctional DNA primase/polymerase [unclassified Streptomyces]MYS24644.1 DNA primase [Streptomyces sp. SID4948]SCE48031.1 Bifunctional DNA primase/polymerase, N-terminal [Streptomyces sp. DvalAA-14]
MAGKNRLSGWLRGRTDSTSVSARGFAQDFARPAKETRGSRARDARQALVTAHRDELITAAAVAGLPLAPAAYPEGYGCSCDRIGCPIPGLHPVSLAWQTQASTEPEKVGQWLRTQPLANFITATGIRHDVLDVPAEAGRLALDRLTVDAATLGPVAAQGEDRMLFFTTTRTPVDEEEWWPCELDCHPETADEHPGIRWHCRGSYVLLPPAQLPSGGIMSWLPGHGPDLPLPDPLPVLDILSDACAQFGYETETESVAWGR